MFCASLWLFYSALFSIVEGEFDPNELILLIISLGILGLVFGGICILFIDENKKPEDIEIKKKKMVESNEFKI